MIPIKPFDPIQIPKGVIDTNGINRGEQVLLYNSSIACLQLTFADKTQDVLPPCWARTWTKDSPMSRILYETLFTVNLAGQPVSQIYGTLYQPGEHISEVNGPLQYVYIAGGGSVSVNSTPFVTNTGFALGTLFISSSFVNELGGHAEVKLYNDGTFILGDQNTGNIRLIGPGGTPFNLQLSGYGAVDAFSGVGPTYEYRLQTSFTNTIAELDLYQAGTKHIAITGDGNIKMDGTLSPTVNQDLLINTDTLHAIRLQNNGSNIVSITSAGLTLNSGKITLIAGSLARMTSFSGTATTTPTNFAHGLGVIPDAIVLTLTGTSTTVSMVKYDPASLTNTNVSIVSDSSRTFVGLAYKF